MFIIYVLIVSVYVNELVFPSIYLVLVYHWINDITVVGDYATPFIILSGLKELQEN